MTTQAASPSRLLTITEMAALLGVTEERLADAAAAGLVPGVGFGAEWIASDRAFVEWLDAPMDDEEASRWRHHLEQ